MQSVCVTRKMKFIREIVNMTMFSGGVYIMYKTDRKLTQANSAIDNLNSVINNLNSDVDKFIDFLNRIETETNK